MLAAFGDGALFYYKDLIRLANAAKTQITRRYLLEFDLSVPEWRLLALTMRFAPARTGPIARCCNR